MAVPRILMYSFKGGSGRTVTASNIAYLMAREFNQKVVFIDLDVESAGSSVLFNLHKRVESGELWTIQDIFRGYWASPDKSKAYHELIYVRKKDFETTYWERLHWPIFSTLDKGFLHVVPARIILSEEIELNARDPEVPHRFEGFLEKIESFDSSPDLIMFDSASGQQESALLGLLNTDFLIIFVRWTRQFIVGTLNFMEQVLMNEAVCDNINQVFIIPTAVPEIKPTGRIGKEVQERQKMVKDKITVLNQDASRNYKKSPEWIRLLPSIHECAALKWDDRIFAMENEDFIQEPDIKKLMEEFRFITSQILDTISLNMNRT